MHPPKKVYILLFWSSTNLILKRNTLNLGTTEIVFCSGTLKKSPRDWFLECLHWTISPALFFKILYQNRISLSCSHWPLTCSPTASTPECCDPPVWTIVPGFNFFKNEKRILQNQFINGMEWNKSIWEKITLFITKVWKNKARKWIVKAR